MARPVLLRVVSKLFTHATLSLRRGSGITGPGRLRQRGLGHPVILLLRYPRSVSHGLSLSLGLGLGLAELAETLGGVLPFVDGVGRCLNVD